MITTYFLKYLSPAVEFSSTGPGGDYRGEIMGRFELLLGEERGGCPVYKQAHSREMPERKDNLLLRWESFNHIFLSVSGLVTIGWLIKMELI